MEGKEPRIGKRENWPQMERKKPQMENEERLATDGHK